MTRYQKTSATQGAWAKASDIKSGTRAKIVSETKPVPSQFTNEDGSPKTQDVAKVRFEGLPDALNVSLNKTTINGLIDAFGDDSVKWQGNYLTVLTEKVRVAGKSVTAMYLIPQGYEWRDDESGYAQVVKIDSQTRQDAPGATKEAVDDIPVIEEGTPVDDANLPF